MRPGLYLRSMQRESRGASGRLLFFAACLAVGVAGVVAVASLGATLDQTIRGEAKQLLAADLVVQGRQPIPPAVAAVLATIPGVRRADVEETITVVAAPPVTGRPGPPRPGRPRPGRSQLVELKAVGPGYPFYGNLKLEPERPLAALLANDGVVAAPDLLTRLGLQVGDSLKVGQRELRIAGVVLSEPDRMSGAFSLGPRLFLSLDSFHQTGLTGAGSRLLYRALVRLPPEWTREQARSTAERLRQTTGKDGRWNVESYTEAQPSLRRGFQRAERFLGLVALLSLLIGAVGVAQAVRAWVASRLDDIAVLECLGVRPREVLALYVGQTVALALAGSVVGCIAGTLVQWVVPPLLGNLLPAGVVPTVQPLALLRGLALGVAVSALFALAPLLTVLRVPPVRVLRRDAEPLPPRRLAQALLLLVVIAGVLVLASLQAASLDLGARFTAGLAAAAATLGLGAALLRRLAAGFPRRRVGFTSRYGLAALARPGAGTIGAAVGLGLGVLVVVGMWQVESQLAAQLDRDLPVAAPNTFLIDIQPEQWAGVRDVLTRAGATTIESVPIVMARLRAIDGKPVEEIAGAEKDERRRRWALTREQRLTYLAELPKDNQIVAGKLWSGTRRDPQPAEVSLEKEFADDIGAHLGSRLEFDVQGVPVELWVTSLRTVKWESFGINFFVVVEPGVLDDAPQQRVAAARLPEGTEQGVQDRLAERYPNVTLLRVREILEKVTGVLRRIGLGVRFLGGFTVLAGIAILAGAISASAARRGREVALLKTLGLTRAGVVRVFALEYALLGLLAGVLGAVSGAVLAWAVLTRGMEVHWRLETAPIVAAIAGTVLLAVLAGVAASWGALRRRPIEALRAE